MAEAKKNNWLMAITVVGPAGDLVYFAKMDNTQHASVTISQHKARAAAIFRRPTKAFEDAVAGGRNALLGLTGAVPIEGGVPIMLDGHLLGAVGVSGGSAPQDGQVAKAGVDALPAK